MRAVKVTLLFGLLLLAFMITVSARSQTGIIVNDADSVTDKSISVINGSLSVVLNQVSPRVVFEFVNSSRLHELPPLPGAFDTRLNQVMPRVLFEFANSSSLHELPSLPDAFDTRLNQVMPRVLFEFANADYRQDLHSPPGALFDLFSQVLPRVYFEFANSSRQQALSYPLALLNDTVEPQISNVSANGIGEDSALIRWTTNEFADSQLNYGTAPGSYSITVNDGLYVKDHAVTLTGLASGQTYYFQVISADQSGNIATSTEFEFTMQITVYLPTIIKNN